MNDMSAVIIAKSDQINADDLISGPRIVTIAAVRISPGTEQPVEMRLEGSDKLFRPCKTVSRVIVGLWGPDASQYVGKSLRLFRDPNVTWAGVKVGGIRIDQASDIDGEKTLVVKESQKASKLHKIKPLKIAPAATTNEIPDDPAFKFANAYIAKVAACTTLDELAAYEASKATRLADLEAKRPDQAKRAGEALTARYAALQEVAREGRTDEQHGDQFDGDDA